MRGAPFARNWWLASSRGLLALLVGGAVFLWPVPTVESLLRLFGAYALLDGLLVVVVAVLVASQPGNWSPLGLSGFMSIGVGMLFSAQPAGVAPASAYLIGAWSIGTGVFEAAAAVRLHSVINSKRLMALGGLASILFGILTIARPDATLVSLAVLFGVFAVLFGTCQTVVGFRLRELAEAMQPLARSEPRQRMLRKASRQWRVR